MKTLPALAAGFVLIVGAPAQASAQVDTTEWKPAWLQVGLGPGVVGATDEDLIGVGVSFTVAPGSRWLVSGRLNYLEEFQLCLFAPCIEAPGELLELAAIVSIATQSRWLMASAGTGVGVVTSNLVPNAPAGDRSTAVGVPVEARLYLRPFRFLGLGATAVANLNRDMTFVAVLFGVQLGGLSR